MLWLTYEKSMIIEISGMYCDCEKVRSLIGLTTGATAKSVAEARAESSIAFFINSPFGSLQHFGAGSV